MLHPEIDLLETLPIKAILIYEKFRASGKRFLTEKTLVSLLKNGEFVSANQYYDCLCLFFALGMLSEENGELRFNNYETS